MARESVREERAEGRYNTKKTKDAKEERETTQRSCQEPKSKREEGVRTAPTQSLLCKNQTRARTKGKEKEGQNGKQAVRKSTRTERERE